MLTIGFAMGAVALAANDLRDDACFVAAQEAFAGIWHVTLTERGASDEAYFKTSTWHETNRWIDPYTLVLESRNKPSEPPFKVMTETISEAGLDLTIESDGSVMEAMIPLSTTCSFDEETGTYQFDMAFERMIDGQVYDTVNQIEVDQDNYALVRLGRPLGSVEARRLINVQYGQRR